LLLVLLHLIMPAELARLMALPAQQVRLKTVSVTFRFLYYSYLYFLINNYSNLNLCLIFNNLSVLHLALHCIQRTQNQGRHRIRSQGLICKLSYVPSLFSLSDRCNLFLWLGTSIFVHL
jgi:hypothetical protein